MRCFIAVDISDDIKDKVLDIQEEISKTGEYTINDPHKMHITLKFLGDISNIDEIKTKLSSIRFTRFDIQVSDIGFFQNNGKPTVVWSGVKAGKNLEHLNEIINDFLGTKEDRPYSPHLTLARVKTCNKNALFDVLKKYKNVKIGEVHVKEFILYKSTLTQQGSIYEPIERFQLKEI